MMRLIKSFKWAGQGLWYCICREKNFQVHIVLAVIAFCLGIGLNISSIEWMLLVISVASVLAAEMMNSAIEHLCNIVHPTAHPTVKIIKDVCAGAVLIIALMAVSCGGIIFIPKVVLLF
jgi:diacylglycerol kinase